MLFKFLSKPGILKPFCATNALGFMVKIRDLCKKKKKKKNHKWFKNAWGQEEKGMTEDEMAGWHHQLDGHEFG